MRKALISILVVFFILHRFQGIAQNTIDVDRENRIISVAVPFLLVPADARSAGMGDMGVATSTDVYSQQWNAAKYAFAEVQQGVGVSYVPYLRKIANDINVGQINYYNRINERSALAGSIRYFNLGKVDSRLTATETGLDLKPNQITLDASYALQLSNNFSMGVTMRYLRSDLKLQTSFEDASAAHSFSTDISGFYQSEIKEYEKFGGQWRAGFAISNIGPKMKYSAAGDENFIPTNLALGGGFDFVFDDSNLLGLYLELNKLLVPTPRDSNGDGVINREDDFYQKSAIEGIFTSFGDAPGGFSEELKEIVWAIGAEYKFQDKFSFRTGYLHESPDKGYRQYVTLGAGFKYSLTEINLSYLFSTNSTIINPLEGGLRFSLSFNFGALY